MEKTENKKTALLKYISIVKRNTNKYFDNILNKYNLGGGQQFFLLRIYENPGITMYDLALMGGFDKATVTKAIHKLVAEGYVSQEMDSSDKRIKRLNITERAMPVIQYLYSKKNEWVEALINNFSEEESEMLYRKLKEMAECSDKKIIAICEEKRKEKSEWL